MALRMPSLKRWLGVFTGKIAGTSTHAAALAREHVDEVRLHVRATAQIFDRSWRADVRKSDRMLVNDEERRLRRHCGSPVSTHRRDAADRIGRDEIDHLLSQHDLLPPCLPQSDPSGSCGFAGRRIVAPTATTASAAAAIGRMLTNCPVPRLCRTPVISAVRTASA